MNEKLPLNSLHLKLLAVVTMLIDHMGFTLFPHAVWMRAVGRLAFPIFCFLIAEGCAHTHDKKRYAGRLLLFAVLSELPFNLMCSGQWLSWNYQNVLWTLLIGALVCSTDYGGWGVLLVTLFYLTREVRNRWAIQLVGLALFCWFCSAWRLEMLAMLSLIPLYLYNGERGFSNKALQYGFYAFYPVHILILSVLARYVF